jgi:hypothetical protein
VPAGSLAEGAGGFNGNRAEPINRRPVGQKAGHAGRPLGLNVC